MTWWGKSGTSCEVAKPRAHSLLVEGTPRQEPGWMGCWLVFFSPSDLFPFSLSYYNWDRMGFSSRAQQNAQRAWRQFFWGSEIHPKGPGQFCKDSSLSFCFISFVKHTDDSRPSSSGPALRRIPAMQCPPKVLSWAPCSPISLLRIVATIAKSLSEISQRTCRFFWRKKHWTRR